MTEVIKLTGTAATGAPMSGATITVKESTGAQVCETGCTVNEDGGFEVGLKSGTKGPFVIMVTQESGDEPQVSMVDTSKSTSVNVSPITTLIAARLSPSGDPTALVASDLTGEKITKASTEVKLALKPVLDAAGVAPNKDLLTSAFKADGTELDKALDVLGKVQITRDATGKATVEIEVKTGGSDQSDDNDNTPAKITMMAGAAPSAMGLTSEKLAVAVPFDGVAPMIANLLQRMQNCYATAPANRRPTNATLASQITASACKEIFIDNDPTKYLHNNYVVSKSGATLPVGSGGRFTGAFSGIFDNTQGVKFDSPKYRYSIKNGNTTDTTKAMNGDVVFTGRWTNVDPKAGINLGETETSEYHARLQNGQLKLVGNQSKHDLSISAQARRDDMPAVAEFSYLSTGYSISVTERRWDHDNATSTPKVSIYQQVVVTSPSGDTFTLKPIPGNNYDYLGLVKPSGLITTTATVRLNGAYQNPATQGHPSNRFTGTFWADKNVWTEEKIAAIPQQGNWKFEITYTDDFVNEASNNISSKTLVQYRRTINRAPTLAGLKSVKWPELTDPIKTQLATQATNQGYFTISSNNVPNDVAVNGWSVAAGAWAPTSVNIYGSGWDERRGVSSNARNTTISCWGTGTHCQTLSNVNTGKFINATYQSLQISGRDQNRRQYSLNYHSRNTTSD